MPRIPPPLMSLLKIGLTHLIKDKEQDLSKKLALASLLVENAPLIIEYVSANLIEGDSKKVETGEKENSESPSLYDRITDALQTASNFGKIKLIEESVVKLASITDKMNEVAFNAVNTGFQKIKVKKEKTPGIDIDNNEYWFRDSDRKIKDKESVKFFKNKLNTVLITSQAELQQAKSTLEKDQKAQYDLYVKNIEFENEKIKISNEEIKKKIPELQELILKRNEEIKLLDDDINSAAKTNDALAQKIYNQMDAADFNTSPQLFYYNDKFLERGKAFDNGIRMGLGFILASVEEMSGGVNNWNTINKKYNYLNTFVDGKDILTEADRNHYKNLVSAYEKSKKGIELSILNKENESSIQNNKEVPLLPVSSFEEYIKSIKEKKEDIDVIHVDKETFLYTGSLENTEAVNQYCLAMLYIFNPIDILIQIYHAVRRLILKIRIFINEIYKALALLLRIKKTAIQIGEDSVEWLSGTFQTVASVGVGASVSTVTI